MGFSYATRMYTLAIYVQCDHAVTVLDKGIYIMTMGRRIRAFLWGDFDPCPLSRMDFLPRAVKILFIRQPIAMIVTYASWYISTSHKVPELLQFFFVIIGLVTASYFLIPYCIVLYKRLKGTNIPFPRFITCSMLAVYFYYPESDDPSWAEAAISFGLSWAFYCILFFLPDNKKLQ